MCQYCVCVLWLHCISLSGLNRFEQSGMGLPKVFYCTPLIQRINLEFISVWWMKDYLSAIRLLGNLSQTLWWFPLSLLPLALMSNSESNFSDLHIAPKLEHQSVIGKCGDIWSNEMWWTHLLKDEDNSAVLKQKSQFLWPDKQYGVLSFPWWCPWMLVHWKLVLFPFLWNFLNAWQTFLFSFAHLKVCMQSWYSWLRKFMSSTSMLDTAKTPCTTLGQKWAQTPLADHPSAELNVRDGSRGETL